MTEKNEAIVDRELLVWARKTAHFTQQEAAHKVHVTEDLLKSWEDGKNRPTIHQLRELGETYKRPIAVFYLPEPPKEFTPLKDFRRFANSKISALSTKLQLETRLAQNRREIAIELYDDLDYEIPKPPQKVNLTDEPETLALKIRNNLKVTRDEQLRFYDDHEAFTNWKTAIEKSGVLVFQINDVDINEIRGFSISDTPLPVIAINNKESRFGRIFTLLHEFVHILIREHGLCDFYENQHNFESRRVEVFCNRVAGAILVPEKYFLLEEPVLENKPGVEWPEKQICILADKYKVSREVIMRRLLILKRITADFYQEKMNEYAFEYQKFEKPKIKWFPLPHIEAINSAGVPFMSLVLDSYNNRKITASDMSDFMNVKLKHVKKIEYQLELHRQK